MASATGMTAVVFFDDHEAAERGVAELHRAGFLAEQIGLVRRTSDGKRAEDGKAVTEAAGIGALAGMSLGGLAAGTLLGLFGGGLAGGLLGALAGRGVPEEEARYYQRKLDEGKVIVTVES